MTTPLGLPAWSRSADHTYYGGHLQKTNYLNQGTIDPLTDVSAEAICRAAEDLAAIARTAPFCILHYACSDSPAGPPTISAVNLMTGVETAGYFGDTPPTGFPYGSRNGNGQCSFLFADTYTDAYGVVSPFIPRFVLATLEGASVSGTISWTIIGQTVRITTKDPGTGIGLVSPALTLMVG